MIRSLPLIALVLLVAPASTARAALTYPSSLNQGDSFRFAFVTSGSIAGTSGDVATYDTFVVNAAQAAGIDTIEGTPIQWHALVSTIRENVPGQGYAFGVTYVQAIDRLPASSPAIFRLDGQRVVPSGTHFWAGGNIAAPWDSYITLNENLAPYSGQLWTGTEDYGTGNIDSNYLGASTFTGLLSTTQLAGQADDAAGTLTQITWSNAHHLPGSTALPLYAFSDVLTVPAEAVETPEPATFVLAALGLTGLGLVAWRRRK